MSDSESNGILVIVITFVITIISGILAWSWIEPKCFWEAIGFLIAWGIFSSIGYFLAIVIAGIFSSMD